MLTTETILDSRDDRTWDSDKWYYNEPLND